MIIWLLILLSVAWGLHVYLSRFAAFFREVNQAAYRDGAAVGHFWLLQMECVVEKYGECFNDTVFRYEFKIIAPENRF